MAEKAEEEVRGCGVGGTAGQLQLGPCGPLTTVGRNNRANLLGTSTDSQKPLKMLTGYSLASPILGFYSWEIIRQRHRDVYTNISTRVFILVTKNHSVWNQ